LIKTATKPLIRLNGPNELVAKLNAVREAAVRWRGEQSPDDLRTMLGDGYERAGKVWSRRLRGRLPQATLRR
jgi:hypothetical protein